MASAPQFEIDKPAVAMIAALGLVVTPLTILAGIWKMTHGLQFGDATIVELVFTVLALMLLGLCVRITAPELHAAAAVRVDEEGIARGKQAFRWEEVDSLVLSRFGVLHLGAGTRGMRLCTYLFRERAAVETYIAERVGLPLPPMSVSR